MPAAALLFALAFAILAAPAGAQTAAPELRAQRAAVAPRLDGVLDDAAWTGQPVSPEQWVSYNPLRGEPGRVRTRVWVAYDDVAVYFALRCFDDDPSA